MMSSQGSPGGVVISSSGGDAVVSNIMPVQGQRLGDTKSRKPKTPRTSSDSKKDKGNCKQQ